MRQKFIDTLRPGAWANDAVACALLLVIAMLAAWISSELQQEFRTLYMPDSLDYRALSETRLDLSAILSARRPPGYPLILSIARLGGSSYAALPYLQRAMFFAAVLILFRSLVIAGFRPWESLVLTLPMVNATVVRDYGPLMLSEIPSLAFAVVSFAVAVVIGARGRSWKRLLWLAAAVFAACMMRPALLFLVLLCPLVALAMAAGSRVVARRRLLVGLLKDMGAVSAPLALYSLLRLAVVGQFGIVSYGGVALAGFGTNPAFLTRATVRHLSPANQALAQRILMRRDSFAMREPAPSRYIYDERAIHSQPLISGWARAFDPSIWKVALPATRAQYRLSSQSSLNPSWIEANRRLGSLSSEVMGLNKPLYVKWLVTAFRTSVQDIFRYERGGRYLLGASVFAIVAVLALLVLSIVITKARPPSVGSAETLVLAGLALAGVLAFNFESAASMTKTLVALTRGILIGTLYPLGILSFATVVTLYRVGRVAGSASRHPVLAYAAATFLFFLSGLALVVMVEVPDKRYLISLSMLMPGAVILVSLKLLSRLTSAWARG